MDLILRRIQRLGVDRGLSENTVWLGLALAAYLYRRARRPSPGTVASVPIAAGETLLVRLRAPGDGGGPDSPPST